MGNAQQMELLNRGVAAWNAWRDADPETVVELSEFVPSGEALRRRGPHSWWLAGANLRGAHLQRAHLGAVDLSGSDLRGAYLDDSDLSGSNLHRVRVFEASFSGATLDGCFLTELDGGPL